jgi:carbamoyltransferase
MDGRRQGMKIAGVFKGETTFGKAIRSGGSALVVTGDDPRVVAVAEERVTGKKYAGGYCDSLPAVLAHEEIDYAALDAIAVSSCCEAVESAAHGLTAELSQFEALKPDAIRLIGHHESHATLAFLGSGYESALVVVSDGGGDVLDGYSGDRWWEHPREQVSYYLATRTGGLELVARDFVHPFDVGFGEFYRAVSYFLGWPGSRHASKVMALAAYGARPPVWPACFEYIENHIECVLTNDPAAPVEMIINLGLQLGVDLGEPRVESSEILEVHRNLAAYTQHQLEVIQSQRISWLLHETGARRLCLGGGVALNVVANGVIQNACGVPTYVSPAPGDDGQALGNALAVCWEEARQPSPRCEANVRLNRSSDAFLGPLRKIDSAAVSRGLASAGLSDFVVFEYSPSAPVVARVLSRGGTVCVFQERSEYGPRALGSRSILGDPRAKDGRALFNQVKSRDWFMPFAPAGALEEAGVATTWFAGPTESPFMSFAVPFVGDKMELVKAVVSNDGTGRVQTLRADEDCFISAVVAEFSRLTHVPMVLNTSFNGAGAPIVETVDQALSTFRDFQINMLALGRFLVVKSLSPEMIEADVMPPRFSIDGYIVEDGTRRSLGLNSLSSRECIRAVQKSTGQIVFVRSELPLFGPYLQWLREGRKVTTIRYRPGAVELPKMHELPLYETEDYGVGDRSRPTAMVRIKSLRYQIFGELTEEDALRDGFESLGHMRTDLGKIYPKLHDSEWVTIYDIGLLDED